MLIELMYITQKIQVRADVMIRSIRIESNQLATVDFVITINQQNFQASLGALAGGTSYFKKPDWHTINGKDYDYHLLSDLFGRPAMKGQIVPGIEEYIKKGTQNFFGNVLNSFEFQESLKEDAPIIVDAAQNVLISKLVTIQAGNRLHATKISNLSFINFVHFALREYLDDNSYQLTTSPVQYSDRYNDPASVFFQTAFFESLRSQCERANPQIALTLSKYYLSELEEALPPMLKTLSGMFGKNVVVASQEEKKPQAATKGKVTIAIEALSHPEIRNAVSQFMVALGSASTDSEARKSLIERVGSSGIADNRQIPQQDVEEVMEESSEDSLAI